MRRAWLLYVGACLFGFVVGAMQYWERVVGFDLSFENQAENLAVLVVMGGERWLIGML